MKSNTSQFQTRETVSQTCRIQGRLPNQPKATLIVFATILTCLFSFSSSAQNTLVNFANKANCGIKVTLLTCQGIQYLIQVAANSSQTQILSNGDEPKVAFVDFPSGVLNEIKAYANSYCSNEAYTAQPNACYISTEGLKHYSPPGFPNQYAMGVW